MRWHTYPCAQRHRGPAVTRDMSQDPVVRLEAYVTVNRSNTQVGNVTMRCDVVGLNCCVVVLVPMSHTARISGGCTTTEWCQSKWTIIRVTKTSGRQPVFMRKQDSAFL